MAPLETIPKFSFIYLFPQLSMMPELSRLTDWTLSLNLSIFNKIRNYLDDNVYSALNKRPKL